MGESYFNMLGLRQFWRNVKYAPDGKRGFYCKSSQNKRRKMRRRGGKGR